MHLKVSLISKNLYNIIISYFIRYLINYNYLKNFIKAFNLNDLWLLSHFKIIFPFFFSIFSKIYSLDFRFLSLDMACMSIKLIINFWLVFNKPPSKRIKKINYNHLNFPLFIKAIKAFFLKSVCIHFYRTSFKFNFNYYYSLNFNFHHYRTFLDSYLIY